MILTKLFNKYIRYSDYNKETQLSLEDKIAFLKYYNLESKLEFPHISFCSTLPHFAKIPAGWYGIDALFIELAYYHPILPKRGTCSGLYWFSLDEEGWNKRKAICNELLGELEEKLKKCEN